MPDACELCRRSPIELTRHHLIPRVRHRKAKERSGLDRDELNGRLAMLCRACHKFIHTVLTEKQMEERYHTLDALASHPEIARFLAWVSTKPPGLRVPTRPPVKRP
ncbi:MAG: hypothetical protein SFV54_07915 [Bryobacteraceae bacterium]|nr:hypothetical protein [Bryobacteraceae bacterium]